MNSVNPTISLPLPLTLPLQKVTVTTTARLHMGFVDLNGSQGRLFGSLGLSLNAPQTQVVVEKSNTSNIDAEIPESVSKVINSIKAYAKTSLEQDIDFSIKVVDSIPEHAGLGSGTQMALAITAGINALFDLGLNAAQMAAITSRGLRSGIGIGTFEQGGLVMDGGRSTQFKDKIPPIIARHHFPTQWPILLILDNNDQGVFGDAELLAFENLPQANLATAQQLSHSVLMQALPAIIEQDYAPFSQAINALQMATGAYFASAQGGHYKSEKVAQVLNFLNQQGIICAGQSSWGPTGFAIFEDINTANIMCNQLQQRFSSSNLQFQMVTANNSGANVVIS